ncbi:hypothetical protein [Geomicrobium sp. JCM 19055]|uniref:hypothetical protein n=1 Tax=Geomicrobium sp. JCM 19055 TaxID=1460649 RepID=UPI00045ED2EC|nr:hypothetical protein [Geomicrobium sp. JCM 19055]GAJ99943.1 hypothetical protein JCM19055_3006 [Geomicrobium sp. JCM 19055]
MAGNIRFALRTASTFRKDRFHFHDLEHLFAFVYRHVNQVTYFEQIVDDIITQVEDGHFDSYYVLRNELTNSQECRKVKYFSSEVVRNQNEQDVHIYFPAHSKRQAIGF